MIIIGIDPGIAGAICFFSDGKIIDVIEKGYKMGNKVIRFTKVVIGK